jgi:hypothetical protein
VEEDAKLLILPVRSAGRGSNIIWSGRSSHVSQPVGWVPSWMHSGDRLALQ